MRSDLARRATWTLVALLACAASPRAQALRVEHQPPTTDQMTADEILRRVNAIYASSDTYQDSGVVYDLADDGRRIGEVTFSTAFVRIGVRLRFEFDAGGGKGVVVQRDGHVRTLWASSLVAVPERSLAGALRQATPITNGAAEAVPSLLNIGVRPPVTRLSLPIRMPDDAASTPPRLRVRGSIGNSLVTLWLHPTSFLVMKREVAFNRSQRLHVVEYTPVVDRPIPPGVFTQPLISDALKAITAVSVVGLGGLGACGLGLLWWSRRTRPVAIGG